MEVEEQHGYLCINCVCHVILFYIVASSAVSGFYLEEFWGEAYTQKFLKTTWNISSSRPDFTSRIASILEDLKFPPDTPPHPNHTL